MRKIIFAAGLVLAILSSCNMKNPLLTESALKYGATDFSKIRNEHYLPAFEAAIAEAKAEIDAITANPEAPTFENTIEAMEYAGGTLNRIAGIFYNLMECNTNESMQETAEAIAPMMTEYSMYVSLNGKLFERVKAVYESRGSLDLEADAMKLLEDTYKSFARNGANLSAEDKETYSRLAEEASVLTLKFSKNVLDATNDYVLNVTDSTELKGLPEFVKKAAAQAAKEKNLEGWAFTLDYPSYSPFLKYSENRELRRQMWMAYNTRAIGGERDNSQIVKDIIGHRIKMSSLLGYETYAEYALEERMAGNQQTVLDFLDRLLIPSLPYARKEVAEINSYAKANGFEGEEIMPWDFSYWSERYKSTTYDLNDEMLKPYFRLDNCIEAVFGLATRLYGITFEETDLPKYHEDVKVYDVKDRDGSHLALFYADFFPRESKRGGAWMTDFRSQGVFNGVERRPHIQIVTNFTKPVGDEPSLITHDELTTLLHEFGHALHGMFAQGRYPSLTGTSVPRDFVELPSQIMENWAFEPEWLNTFAKHYQTGEVIPAELIEKIVNTKNYLAAYSQVRQLQFGILDMAWHTLTSVPEVSAIEFEKNALRNSNVMPSVDNAGFSTSFGHIFSGGYAAGYYSYKWAEVLEADAFSLFKEKGIFNREVAQSFRDNILSKGGTLPADEIYRNFRGHDPQPEALMEKLGLKQD